MTVRRLTQRELNRALLARQGLLEPLALPVDEAVEAVGALQAQHWPSIPVALWSRLDRFDAGELYRALDERRLLLGTLIRGTLHVVSAREHPAYAAVTEESGVAGWRRVAGFAPEGIDVRALCDDLVAHATRTARPLGAEDFGAFVEAWVARSGDRDAAWLDRLRQSNWRPFRTSSAFVRAPAGGRWAARAPETSLAAGCLVEGPPPAADEALAAVVRRHLRAFGPASAEDVASWIGWRVPEVREALRRLEPELVRFEDEAGRPLHDLADAPRPAAGVPAPVRFLPGFDSTLLAYASGRRQRIMPDAHRDVVYVRANLQVLPSFLVDGLVAGTWSSRVQRREAVLALRPLARVGRAERAALLELAERLVRFLQPEAAAHSVVVEPAG